MRSKTSKIKQALDRLERKKYKNERRIDNLKKDLVTLNSMIDQAKTALQENTSGN